MAKTVKPVFSSDFAIPEEGMYLFSVTEVDFNSGEKGLTCAVRSTITEALEHKECEGMNVFDNFPLWTDFGVQRLLGLLVVAVEMPNKEYPADYFSDVKVQDKVAKKLKGSVFGGKIKHTKGEKGVFANITKYLARSEFAKLSTTSTTSAVETQKEETVDW